MLKQYLKSSFRLLLKRIKDLLASMHLHTWSLIEKSTQVPAPSTELVTKPSLSNCLPLLLATASLSSFSVCKTQDKYWESSACISPSSHSSPDRLFSPLTQGILFLWAFSKHTYATKPTYPHPKPSRRMPFISCNCAETRQGNWQEEGLFINLPSDFQHTSPHLSFEHPCNPGESTLRSDPECFLLLLVCFT